MCLASLSLTAFSVLGCGDNTLDLNKQGGISLITCTDDEDCTGKTWCNSGTHKCVDKMKTGSVCNRSSQCSSDICSNDTCGCLRDSDCKADYFCDKDAICRLNECDPATEDCEQQSDPTTHCNPLIEECSCLRDSDCKADYFCDEDDICRLKECDPDTEDCEQQSDPTTHCNPLIEDCEGEYGQTIISGGGNTQTRDTFPFGKYWMKPDTSSKESINWIILEDNEEDHTYLLISEKVLDVLIIQGQWVTDDYDQDRVRAWLNGYDDTTNAAHLDFTEDNFIDAAFSSEEQARIVTSTVTNGPSQYLQNSIDRGDNTHDKIYLMSIDEANYYFDTKERRQAQGTAFTKSRWHLPNGEAYNPPNNMFPWTLRSAGTQTDMVANVGSDGSFALVDTTSYNYTRSFVGIRPVIRVKYQAEGWN